MSEQIEAQSDLEAVARALCQYDSGIQEMPADEMWELYSSEYMKDAELSMAVLAPLFASKREAGYQAGYLDGIANGKADARRIGAMPSDFDLQKCWIEKPDGIIDGIASMRLALEKYGGQPVKTPTRLDVAEYIKAMCANGDLPDAFEDVADWVALGALPLQAVKYEDGNGALRQSPEKCGKFCAPGVPAAVWLNGKRYVLDTEQDKVIADLEDAIVFKDAAIGNLGVLIDELRDQKSLTPENQLPLATEEEKKAGWTLSYKFLESLSDTIDSRPAMETVEAILLNAKQVFIAMKNPAVQHILNKDAKGE